MAKLWASIVNICHWQEVSQFQLKNRKVLTSQQQVLTNCTLNYFFAERLVDFSPLHLCLAGFVNQGSNIASPVMMHLA